MQAKVHVHAKYMPPYVRRRPGIRARANSDAHNASQHQQSINEAEELPQLQAIFPAGAPAKKRRPNTLPPVDELASTNRPQRESRTSRLHQLNYS